MSIHTIAERYLRDLKTGRASFYQSAAETEIVPLAESLTERVVLMRLEEPHFLVGVKKCGKPVFTHDLKLAASFDPTSLKLVEALTALERRNIHTETMPACWFSNHQHG
jgi:hypothetical protein